MHQAVYSGFRSQSALKNPLWQSENMFLDIFANLWKT